MDKKLKQSRCTQQTVFVINGIPHSVDQVVKKCPHYNKYTCKCNLDNQECWSIQCNLFSEAIHNSNKNKK